jgi:hypothetical protein
MQELFRDRLGEDAATSLDAPFAMGKAGVLEDLFGEAGLTDVSYRHIESTGRFDSIDQWVTTEIRGWTLSESISEEQLADLVEAAREHLGEFETADGRIFGMTAKVAIWNR